MLNHVCYTHHSKYKLMACILIPLVLNSQNNVDSSQCQRQCSIDSPLHYEDTQSLVATSV